MATGVLLGYPEKRLTRMVATYYWIGLNVYKQAQSVLGNVVCCSGCLAAWTPLKTPVSLECRYAESTG